MSDTFSCTSLVALAGAVAISTSTDKYGSYDVKSVAEGGSARKKLSSCSAALLRCLIDAISPAITICSAMSGFSAPWALSAVCGCGENAGDAEESVLLLLVATAAGGALMATASGAWGASSSAPRGLEGAGSGGVGAEMIAGAGLAAGGWGWRSFGCGSGQMLARAWI